MLIGETFEYYWENLLKKNEMSIVNRRSILKINRRNIVNKGSF
jgi:hypothetical protein